MVASQDEPMSKAAPRGSSSPTAYWENTGSYIHVSFLFFLFLMFLSPWKTNKTTLSTRLAHIYVWCGGPLYPVRIVHKKMITVTTCRPNKNPHKLAFPSTVAMLLCRFISRNILPLFRFPLFALLQ